MECDDKLKEIDFKNRTCFYFDDIVKIEDFVKIEDCDQDNISVDKKSYENILVYSISYKNVAASKPSRIRFDKTDL